MAKTPTKRSTKRPGKEEIEAIFAAFQRDNPDPKGELVSVNAFTLLVAVVLSAQATDAGVNKATPALFRLADTPQKMVKLGVEQITDLMAGGEAMAELEAEIEEYQRTHDGHVPAPADLPFNKTTS